jgi:hypothetical protein
MKKIILVFTILFCAAGVIHAQDSLKIYAGKYTLNEGAPVPEIEIVFEAGKLTVKSAQGIADLEKAEGNDAFTVPQYNATAKFTRNENNKIAGVRIELNGTVLEGTKDTIEPVTPNKEFTPHTLIHPKRLLGY